MELSSIDRSLVIWIMTPVSVERDLMANMAIGSLSVLVDAHCVWPLGPAVCIPRSPTAQDLAIEHLWVFWRSGLCERVVIHRRYDLLIV